MDTNVVIQQDYIQSRTSMAKSSQQPNVVKVLDQQLQKASFQNVLQSALSGENQASHPDIRDSFAQDYCPKVVSHAETVARRGRFDTLEEMELLGQGRYGSGNVPIIAKGLDA